MKELEIKSNIKLGLADILKGLAKLEVDDIELFLKEVSTILAKKKLKEPQISQEALLLQKIESAYPEELKKRYHILHDKMEQEILSQEEEKELLKLSDHFEALDAERLQHLLELAKLKEQPLNVIIKKFPSSTAYV